MKSLNTALTLLSLSVLLASCGGSAVPANVVPSSSSAPRTVRPVVAAQQLEGLSGAYATALYGTINTGLGSTSLGPVTPVSASCLLTANHASYGILEFSQPPYVSIGATVDSYTATRDSQNATMQAVAETSSVNLLNGLISATLVHEVGNTSATTSSLSASGDGTQIVGLTVAGIAYAVTPAPNTRIDLPGVGYVILNEQQITQDGNSVNIKSAGIDLNVTVGNPLGLNPGSQIFVSRAESSFSRTAAAGTVVAGAFGPYAHGFSGSFVASSGPWAAAGIPCGGGTGHDAIAYSQSPVFTTGAITTDAAGQITPTGSNASASASISNTNILQGLITIDLITAKSAASLSGGVPTSSGSTSLVNAVVAGTPVAVNPGANTSVNLAGLGYVILNEQTGNATSSTVSQQTNSIDLYVTIAPNQYNMPIGSQVIVGNATTQLTAP